MELTRYSIHRAKRRGPCHGIAAANRVEDLVRASHGRVRLSSQHPGTDHKGRLIRWIAVRQHGRWQDVGEILMREGENGTTAFYILSGTIELFINNPLSHVESSRKPAGNWLSGLTKITNYIKGKLANANKIKAEDYGVRVGPKGRKVSYLTAPLEGGGGQVTRGTASITVGPPQHSVAAVTHDTSDGSPIANGEDSIHMIT
jgi:hypothetical protein